MSQYLWFRIVDLNVREEAWNEWHGSQSIAHTKQKPDEIQDEWFPDGDHDQKLQKWPAILRIYLTMQRIDGSIIKIFKQIFHWYTGKKFPEANWTMGFWEIQK